MAYDPKRGLAKGLTNYGDPAFSLYLRRSFAKSMGYSGEMLARPVVGIADSRSGFNNCHRHFPELIEAVKRGVLAAGGLPVEFPTTSLGEVFLSPTSMMFRNLMAMDVEEMVRAQPMDAVVLVGGCDKTVPAQLMGAASADLPAVQLLAGPMMPTSYRGERLGACTDCRRFWALHRAGKMTSSEIESIEGNLATTAGTCAVMGTASTMAAIAEALGMALPGSAAIPAVHADRLRAAEASGRRATELTLKPIRPSEIITRQSVENALRVLLAIGGSTNAIVHLTAIAGRVGVKVDLNRLNQLSDSTPVLVDLKPTGQFYMSDLYAAGGVGAVLRELKPLLHLDCMTVAGETLGERLAHDAGAWVHVDGAFGLWAIAAPSRFHLTKGMAEADSWATDAHKWLNVPYDSGIAFVRDREALRAAMAITAEYLPTETEHRNPSDYVPELSRRARGVEIWAALKSLGRSGVADLVERTCRHARRFAEGLSAAGYEILNDVVLNQTLVSFGDADTTHRVIADIQREGTCWSGGTVWQGRTAMRISVSSWATTDEDVERSLEAMIRCARHHTK